jgi:hypothetical protein
MNHFLRTALVAVLVLAGVSYHETLAGEPAPGDSTCRITWNTDQADRIVFQIDGREAFVLARGPQREVPYFFPVRSPSGKVLTEEFPKTYPHHRSFWFADTVQPEGKRKVSFYGAFYTRLDPKDPKSAFRDHIRLVEFQPGKCQGSQAEVSMKLLWEMDQTVPVLDETRTMQIKALGDGEYFLDLTFIVTANYGNVAFISDAVHYAWPFVRISPEFSVQSGGKMVNSEGGVNQAGTNDKPAHWIDYSNTVDGATEGLAIFSHPDNPYPHKWLTRDYGTFGPRRIDAQSGKPFTLAKGESLKQRVGILVHRGDVAAGHVAERYGEYK